MDKNPYTEIIDVMRQQGKAFNPPSILIGEVSAPPPDLKIKIGNIQIDKDNILVADRSIFYYFNYVGDYAIKPGDRLAIMPTQDMQTFIVLCRVVAI